MIRAFIREQTVKRRIRLMKRDRSGVVTIEFALLAPLMAFVFLGLVELSQAHMLRKTLESNITTLADLVAQQRELDNNDATGIVAGFNQLMEPAIGSFDPATTSFYIASVSRRDASTLIVDWSFNQDLQAEFVSGETYTDVSIADEALLRPGVSVIIAKVLYSGEDAFSYQKFLGGSARAGAPRTIERHAIRWPRRSMRISYDASP